MFLLCSHRFPYEDKPCDSPPKSSGSISTSTASSPRSSSRCIRTCAASPSASCRSPTAQHTCVIACSREAKLLGVKNVMNIEEARERCPDIIFVPQSPDLYRRAHNTLLSEISAVIPVDAVKSIDELTCRVAPADRGDPRALGLRIKKRIADNVGPFITCSIGFAANRQLAKMACKAGKPNGNMVWHPNDMPGPLLELTLRDIPGIGERMEQRLAALRHHDDGRSPRHAAEAHAQALGQRDRRAALVRAARLRRADAALGSRHVRPRPRAAAGSSDDRARQVRLAAAARQGGAADAARRLERRPPLALA